MFQKLAVRTKRMDSNKTEIWNGYLKTMVKEREYQSTLDKVFSKECEKMMKEEPSPEKCTPHKKQFGNIKDIMTRLNTKLDTGLSKDEKLNARSP